MAEKKKKYTYRSPEERDFIRRIHKQFLLTTYTERTTRARAWIRHKVLSLKNSDIRYAPSRKTWFNSIGTMYFFWYDAKHKDTLPYWDRFPLIFPIETYGDGFLGLNLHYLDLRHRILLLDRLSDYRTNNKYSPDMRLQLSYGLIKSTKNLDVAKPCIKRYLTDHVKSQFIEVLPAEWDIACYMPVQRFVGGTTLQVHKESRQKIYGK